MSRTSEMCPVGGGESRLSGNESTQVLQMDPLQKAWGEDLFLNNLRKTDFTQCLGERKC